VIVLKAGGGRCVLVYREVRGASFHHSKTEAEETYQDNVRIQPGDYIIITSKLYQIQLVLSGVPIGKVGEQDKFSHIQLYFGVIKERNDSGESNNAG